MKGSGIYPLVVMLLLLVGFPSGLGWAQNTDGGDQSTITLLVQQIRELQKQTGELQEKVKALEAEKGQVTPSPEAAEAGTAGHVQIADRIGAGEAWDKAHGIQWRGFG